MSSKRKRKKSQLLILSQMKIRHTLLLLLFFSPPAQLLVYQLKRLLFLKKNIKCTPLISPDSPWSPAPQAHAQHAHTFRHSLALRNKRWNWAARTFFTVPSMMLFPTGMRMPPRTASSAPITAPAISPHSLLQQPMVVCVSLRLTVCLPPCLPACLPAWLPSLAACFSFCLCVSGVC